MDLISLAPPVLFELGGFPVTNTLFVSVLLSLFLLVLGHLGTRRMQLVPSGVQFWMEVVFEVVYNFMYTLTKSARTTQLMFPLIMTLFLFILFGNLFAYVPGLGAFTYKGTAIYRTATSDYSLVLMLTIISVGLTQAVMLWTGGIFTYIKKFINFSGPWSQKPINLFLGIMDLIGEGAKIISLSFRLFGNMFAGEVLASVVGSLAPFVLPLPFALLGLLTTFVQPAVFSMFTALNISGAIVPSPAKPENENP
jgi:F-type H+-transporting ATPase subunit a